MKNSIMACVGLSVAIALTAAFAQQDAKAEKKAQSQREFVPTYGISPTEIVQIATSIQQASDLKDKRIMAIRVVPGQKVEVETGSQEGPLAGGGNIITLRKSGQKWEIERIMDWVS